MLPEKTEINLNIHELFGKNYHWKNLAKIINEYLIRPGVINKSSLT